MWQFHFQIPLIQHSVLTCCYWNSYVITEAMRLYCNIDLEVMGPIGITFPRVSYKVLQESANGTFLYLTFFEIFQRELAAERGSRLLKVLSMIVGNSFVTGLLYYANILEYERLSVSQEKGIILLYNLVFADTNAHYMYNSAWWLADWSSFWLRVTEWTFAYKSPLYTRLHTYPRLKLANDVIQRLSCNRA